MAILRFLKRLAQRHRVLAQVTKPIAVPVIVGAIAVARETSRLLRMPVNCFGAWQSGVVLKRRKAKALSRLLKAVDASEVPGVAAHASGRYVLMIVVSDLRIDPRVEREARALANGGYDVWVLCPSPIEGDFAAPAVDWGPGITIRFIENLASQFVTHRPGYEGGLLFDAALTVARETMPFAIHAHDLNTCLVGLAVARLTGAHLVADFHEWTSENVHWDDTAKAWAPYPLEWKVELQALEARIMREASAVITVSGSIVDAIAEELGAGRRPGLIRNIPDLSRTPTKDYGSLRDELGICDDQFLILYQGGIGPTRCIEPVIAALAHAPGCVLAIRGPRMDLFGDGYRLAAEKAGVSERLHLMSAVPSADVVAAAKGADAGLYTVVGSCRNYELALPNKVYEYIAAGLPVLVAAYPEVSRFVCEGDIGLAFDPENPQDIAAAMNQLAVDAELAARFRVNAAKALASIDGEREWQKLVDLYEALDRAPAQPVKAFD